MKVRVLINAVSDRDTGEVYLKGTEFDLPEDRALDAISHGYVEEVKNVGTKKSGKTRTTNKNG